MGRHSVVAWEMVSMLILGATCRGLASNEAVLLVGETGTGKTTVCQAAALIRGQRLHMFNCNQHTDASDFLGGFRPARYVHELSPDLNSIEYKKLVKDLKHYVHT